MFNYIQLLSKTFLKCNFKLMAENFFGLFKNKSFPSFQDCYNLTSLSLRMQLSFSFSITGSS